MSRSRSHIKQAPSKQAPSTRSGRLLRLALPLAALLLALAACSQQPRSPTPASGTTSAPTEAPERPNSNAVLPRGPFFSPPLHQGYVPGGEIPQPIAPLAVQDEVEMKALLVSATRNESEQEPSTGAWIALLEQAGVPYDWFIASEREALTPEHLIREDGVGRYQAILLSTSNLVYEQSEGNWPSAMDATEWGHLFQYQLEYGVRQAALFAAPFDPPEDLGVTPVTNEHTGLDGVNLTATPSGLEIFTDLAPDSQIEIYGTSGFPSTDPIPGATPLLMLGSEILAIHVNTGGRERVAMLFNNPAWGASNTPAIYTQQLGPSLLRWALGGIHIGEKRNSYQADVDDWFNTTGLWDTDLAADHPDDEFAMTAKDAFSVVGQQEALRAIGGGIAPDFRWSMAYNGYRADPASIVDCTLPSAQHTLSSATRCLKDEFWWVSHTWTHAYMDWNPPHVGLEHSEIVEEIGRNDQLSQQFGFGDNDSRRSLVTGDISGLGWHSRDGPDSGPKVDYGLDRSNEHLLTALVATGHPYLASNMSTKNHEPDCWACGMVHPMNDGVFLVPRWPTNLFASVTTPASVVQAYNMIYGPDGTTPIEGIQEPLTYEQILDIDTDIALVHLLSGSPYPHYFHIANLYEYETGRSTLFDWTEKLFTKYADFVDEPILSYKNDDFGDYVRARTEFLDAGVSGVWDRSTGLITITSANGGPVFLTGASLGGAATDFVYNGRRISQRQFGAGEQVVVDVGVTPTAPAVSLSATPTNVVEGSTTTLSWNVGADYHDVELRTVGADATVVAAGLPRTGSRVEMPTATTTYQLAVTWAEGTVLSDPVTVTVAPVSVQPSGTLTADPDTIIAGGSTTLTWAVTGDATAVSIRVHGSSSALFTGLATSGSQPVAPAENTTYELVMAWAGGEPVVQAVTVTVDPAPVAPTTQLTVSPSTIDHGGSTTLSWTVTGESASRYIRVQGTEEPLYPDLGPSGSRTVAPTATTTYELVAAWSGGTAVSAPVTITVNPPPVRPTATFGAAPGAIDAGGSATLSWNVSGDATTTTLRAQGTMEPLAVGLAAVGSHTVSPSATTTYDLVMTWAGGSPVVETTTVTVRPAPDPDPEPEPDPEPDPEPEPDPDPDPEPEPDPEPDPDPDPDPVEYTLTLQVSGDGFGVVISSPLGISCLADCSTTFPEGTVLTLTPVPLLGSTFETFTGACTQESCTVVVDRDMAVGAIFTFEER